MSETIPSAQISRPPGAHPEPPLVYTSEQRRAAYPDAYAQLAVVGGVVEAHAKEAGLSEIELTKGEGNASVHLFTQDETGELHGRFVDVEGLGLPPFDAQAGKVFAVVRSGSQEQPDSLEVIVLPPPRKAGWGSPLPLDRVDRYVYEPGRPGKAAGWVARGKARVSYPAGLDCRVMNGQDNHATCVTITAAPGEAVTLFRGKPTPAEKQQGFILSPQARKDDSERRKNSNRRARVVAVVSGAMALGGFIGGEAPQHGEIAGGSAGIERYVDDIAARTGFDDEKAIRNTAAALAAAERDDTAALSKMVKAEKYQSGWLDEVELAGKIAAASNTTGAVQELNKAFHAAGIDAYISAPMAVRAAESYDPDNDSKSATYDVYLHGDQAETVRVKQVCAAISRLFNNLPKKFVRRDPPKIQIVSQTIVDGRKMGGYYDPNTDMITIAAEVGDAWRIVNHEVAHDIDQRGGLKGSADLTMLDPDTPDSDTYVGGAVFGKVPVGSYVGGQKVTDREYGRYSPLESYAVAAESTLGGVGGVNEFDASPASAKRLAQIMQFESAMPGFAANYALKSQPNLYQPGAIARAVQEAAALGRKLNHNELRWGEGVLAALAGLISARNSIVSRRANKPR